MVLVIKEDSHLNTRKTVSGFRGSDRCTLYTRFTLDRHEISGGCICVGVLSLPRPIHLSVFAATS